MANVFPTTLNDWEAAETIESGWADALENKLGVDASAVATSIDYLIKHADSKLGAISRLAATNSNFIVGDGTNWVAESGATARTSLGLVIGTDVQAYDAQLADLAGLAVTDSNFIVGDGSNFVLETAATARTSLGLGTAAVETWGANLDDLVTVGAVGADSEFLVGTGAGTLAWESAATAFTSIKQAASATATGVVELATTAETATGTDTARAVTPDGLHDMTTLAGAAWFLDEDNMSSNSATKVSSQQAIKAYADLMLPLTGGTMSGVLTLGENAAIALDPAGSADGKYSGITIAGTGGATIAFGDLIYLQASDSRWELADADAVGTAGDILLGMAATSSTDGAALTILLYGQIRADAAFPALTIGDPVYAGNTPGDVQVAVPTGVDDVVRVVGYAITADEIIFNPSPDHITRTA